MGIPIDPSPGILLFESGWDLVTCLEPIEYSKSDGMSRLCLGYRKTVTSILLEDALLLALMKQASCLGGMAHVTWN